MLACDREKLIYGKDVRILSKDGDCTVYGIGEREGDVIMTSHSVFPGIDLIYNDVHTERCAAASGNGGELFEINHCREGRIECRIGNEFFYLSAGDLSVNRKTETKAESCFPTGHYHGITIMIDTEKAPECLSCLLDDVNVNPEKIRDKFCGESDFYVMRAKPEIEHLFSELYRVPEEIKKGYFKVKILELLLFLSAGEVSKEKMQERYFTKTQVALAKEVREYLTSNSDRHVTIDTLSQLFHASQTQIKKCFRGVFGISVYSFIRAHKMRLAADMLGGSEKTVLEIAGSLGYDNGSKFAKAFSDIMGKSPSEFRRENYYEQKINIL